jgi:hypothetical protein
VHSQLRIAHPVRGNLVRGVAISVDEFGELTASAGCQSSKATASSLTTRIG